MQARMTTVLVVLGGLCAAVRLTYATSATGSVTPGSGWYPSGTNLLITATPEFYSEFERWEGAVGAEDVSADTINCTVDSSKTLTAVFVDAVTETNSVPHRWLAEIYPDWTNNFESAATNDWDNDGFTTAEEYLAGTCPTNANSFLHIASARIVGDQLQMDWMHDQVYPDLPPIAIQRRDSLSSGYWEHAGQYSPTNGVNTWSGSIAPQAFYRLAVTNAP